MKKTVATLASVVASAAIAFAGPADAARSPKGGPAVPPPIFVNPPIVCSDFCLPPQLA
ncbi:MAG: hypothetical protein ACJ747_04865 [Gaiellaceae bacterium]|jgi:hypothetical protein